MKSVLIIPDGCADEPQASLDGRTPLEAAHTPHMDAVVEAGLIGQAETVPESMPSGSDVGTMSLFGYDPLEYHTGRAPLEAAAQGIELGPGDWAVRCNLVTIDNGIVTSFTAGQVANDLASHLIELMQNDQDDGSAWTFHTGVSYRNLLVYRAHDEAAPFSEETTTYPPHDITDRDVEPYLPQGPGSETFRELMSRSNDLFQQSAQNRANNKSGECIATDIWLWGQGRAPGLESFEQRFGKTAAVITAVDLLRGLGTILGWQVVDVPGATGYIDTDYAAKGRAAIETLKQTDLVVVHVEATDEASHEGDVQAKVEALQQIDEHIVGPVHQYLKGQGDYRVLISPDHPTFLRTKTHSHGEVPFALCGNDVMPDEARTYDESTASQSNMSRKGHELMPMLLGS